MTKTSSAHLLKTPSSLQSRYQLNLTCSAQPITEPAIAKTLTHRIHNQPPPPAHQLPVDGLEEGVVDDVLEARLGMTAEPLPGVLVEEALEDAARLDGEGARDPDRLLQDH